MQGDDASGPGLIAVVWVVIFIDLGIQSKSYLIDGVVFWTGNPYHNGSGANLSGDVIFYRN